MKTRLDEIRERRAKEYGHSFTETRGTVAAMADIDYLLSLLAARPDVWGQALAVAGRQRDYYNKREMVERYNAALEIINAIEAARDAQQEGMK